MKKLALLVLIFGVLLGAHTGWAQDDDPWGFEAEDYEFTLQGSGSSDNELDNTTLSFEGSIGYFFNQSMELGLRQGIGYVDVEGGSDKWAGSSRGFLDFHFDFQKLQPFVGANFGYLYGDDVNDSFIAGPEGGLKLFLIPSTFLYALAEYNFTFESADEADEAFDDGRFVYALGLGFIW